MKVKIIPIVICAFHILERIIKGAGGLANKKKSEDYPN